HSFLRASAVKNFLLDRRLTTVRRKNLRAAGNFYDSRAKSRLTYLLRGGERGVVVRVIADAAHVFGMFYFVVRADDKNSAGQNSIERAAGNQHPVVLTEGSIPVVAGGNDFVDIGRAAPTLLRERKIHADANNFHVGQLACLFVEPFRFQ